MGQYIHDSKLINEAYDCYYLNPSASKSVEKIGKLRLNKITFLFSFLYRILKTYRKFKPDICYLTPSSGHWGFYRDFVTVFVLKLFRVKIVAHFQNKGKPSFGRKWYNKILYRYFFKGIHAIFLAKPLVKEFQSYLNNEHIHICPNAVPVMHKHFAHRTQSHTPFTFLFLSNMMEEKGVWILLEACSILKKRGYFFQCDYVGQWSDISEDDFINKVAEYELTSQVRAYGAKYGEEKLMFFQKADAFVFPTFYHGETFGIVLIEAMECALPCISTYEGGISDVVEDGHSGFLVKPKDVDALVDKMIYMMEHPEEGIKMGNYGRELFLNKFTFGTFEYNFTNIINKILNINKLQMIC
jgi:glycosyltransferase involved in cell wall biosynthesis